MNNLEQLRERFEAEFKQRGYDVTITLGSETYRDRHTHDAWQGYQAAHISAVKQCAEIVRNVEVGNKYEDYSDDYAKAILALLPTNESEVK